MLTTPKSYLWSALFCALGAAAFWQTATANYHFGESIANSQTGSLWMGMSSLYVDTMLAALAGVLGLFWTRRRYIATFFVGLLLIGYGGLSLYSLVGWGAAERIQKSVAVSANNDAIKTLTEKKNALAIAAYQDQLRWSREIYVKQSKTKRAELLTGMHALPPPALEAPVIQTVMPDAQAVVMAGLLDFRMESVQLGGVVALAIALVVGKAVCFFFAGYFWPAQRKTEDLPATKEVPGMTTEGAAEAVPAPAPVNENEPVVAENDSELAKKLAPDVEGHEAQRFQVEAYLREATIAAPSARITATAMYHHYCDWTRSAGYPPMTQKQFAMLLRSLGGVSSKKGQLGKVYTGRSLSPIGEEAGPQLMAA